ncbi:AgmX/PglI C-terminal domain-containing protein [Leptospira sp. 2 VSF19]|uniref:AgmX/PglI C-terminal domain-containing protein n=1 Tax=Leptospira soteropolitanensis TaxID=2950025 RepID=A0AAW5VTG3_9LEPT|nr:AgmX/PglI C-terminal domain-containing protein [Leptospira soteropolitanensis]MCW7494622.1 AgmX/PglI C-terminal domain-containing protein [Leptospira soteropolitanensis]MCW7502210.1 AgmX/PglI C-terminal domain-containing protein [Leptospira soteropolitanensis]MCW7524468.1 AgmX/PglI C-terminal domain-containing protein [Leptospira soteropolitanensis]MCW7528334.1 AgmX/PglI C-terminal domain-containing protein [Leptospira soteropolitanensis]MCW7532187.1 AgmX/PglI C-terminal domain-containing p
MKKAIPFQKEILLVTVTTLLWTVMYLLFLRPISENGSSSRTPSQIDTRGLTPYHKREVNLTIAKHKIKIQHCYKQYLESKPQQEEGKIQFDWQIEPDGDPTKVELIHSDFSSNNLTGCIQNEIGSWEFPPPPERSHNTYVEYTFHFKKEETFSK